MDIVIEQAKLIFPGHAMHQKKVNIKLKQGILESISTKKINGGKSISFENLHISPSWIDVGTYSGEPGFEHRESLQTLSDAAIAGGYSILITQPNTLPVVQSKSELEYIIQKSTQLPISIYPLGAISKDCNGKELAEMIDMHTHGAIAFSDGKNPIQDTGVMLRAMLYANHFDGLLVNQPVDQALSALGQMHEGKVSQRLGLKGIPEVAETIMIKRDIDLAGYTGSKLLFHLISTEEGVKIISQAKKSNSRLFSSISYLNLVLIDEALEGFDSNLKQSPPLRSNKHLKALQKGLQDGSIDIICSNHRPLEIEKKDLEYAYATPGAIGLETSFAAVNKFTTVSLETWVQCVAINPRRIFNLPVNSFKEGSPADITLFNPDLTWQVKEHSIKSKSKNGAFIGQELKGKVLGVYSKGNLFLN